MAKKTKFVDEKYLATVPKPSFEGNTYTVVSHDEALKNMRNTLTKFGYSIINEKFKVAEDGKIAMGSFGINLADEEMKMMIGFVNSYNKKTSFKYKVGTNITVCDNLMILGTSLFEYKRKHTGDVDIDAFLKFDEAMTNITSEFEYNKQIREELKLIPLSTKEMAELAGRMFVEEELLTPRQMSDLKIEIMKPSFDYSGNNNTGWEFYNHLTHVAKRAHPTTYFSHHEKLSDFVINEFGILQNKTTIEEINYELLQDSFQ